MLKRVRFHWEWYLETRNGWFLPVAYSYTLVGGLIKVWLFKRSLRKGER